jgi:hypothetical protein
VSGLRLDRRVTDHISEKRTRAVVTWVELASMLEIVVLLIIGFALGYGVREWAFRRYHPGEHRRRRPF